MENLKGDILYQIALTLIEGIGDVGAKNLLAYCGSAEEVFRQKKGQLQKIPGIGSVLASSVFNSKSVFSRAEKEIRFIQKYKIKPVFFTNEDYPGRLKNCSDGPVLLYYKGNADLNAAKTVGVIGTRRPSEYGREMTEKLIQNLEGSGILVISGLAYGVDVLAHRKALEFGLQTVGVLGHGLDRIYPGSHAKTAKRMLEQGGLLTEFMSDTNPDAVNFPKRNRIVAGLCDALVVVESKRSGGSLITATIANSYNRDVFAFPGKAGEALSEGGNGLIKQNKASLIEHAEDLLYAMQWQPQEKPARKSGQIPLQVQLSDDERAVFGLFDTKPSMHMDEICLATSFPVSKVSTLLLQLEFSNLVKSKPGKMFERV
ncbi:MAG TPA: DNA-processing protein DprA [Bacteroidia bacterium]|nr:DNA-processing protein DprA [Bacteroidia bacterium]